MRSRMNRRWTRPRSCASLHASEAARELGREGMTMDPADITATAALQEITAGRLSAAAVREACLARVAEREPVLQALAAFDPAAVRAAGSPKGRLGGLPLGVKDVLDTADLPTEYGSPIWQGHRPRADAACVAWARDAGAIVFGKTVTTEFATRQPGATTNPHDPGRTPGGSSSGSAAGVAAGYFPFAFGTQTAGSIIRPAAYCGVVGYKPSFGTINRHGMKLMSESLDTVGVFARSVADCALLTQAVSDLPLGDVDAPPARPFRVGLCRSPMWDRREPETEPMFEIVAAAIRGAGAVVGDVTLPNCFAPLEAAHTMVMNAESARALGWEMTTDRDRLSKRLARAHGVGGWPADRGIARSPPGVPRPAGRLRRVHAGIRRPTDTLRRRHRSSRSSLDRRSRLQPALDRAPRPLRDRPRRHGPVRDAARHPTRCRTGAGRDLPAGRSVGRAAAQLGRSATPRG